MDIPKTIVPWSLRDRGKLISFDNFFPRSSQRDTGEQAQRDPVTCLNLILRDAIIIVSNLRLEDETPFPNSGNHCPTDVKLWN